MVSAALALVAAAALGGPPAAPAGDPAEAFRRAEALYASEKFAEAEGLYRRALDADAPLQKRQAFERLTALYVRSGRQDKAVRVIEAFRAWLVGVGDLATVGELDVLLGECYLGLGYYADAAKNLDAALAARPPVSADRNLQALHLRAEVAAQTNDPKAAERWAALEAAATAADADAAKTADTALRAAAGRHLADALHRRGDTAAAVAALAPLPDLLDKLGDPLGRRDAQRQRAILLAARGKYEAAEPLFKEALALQREHRPAKRAGAGDILADWADAALAAGKRDDAVRLRNEAAAEYRAVLDTAAKGEPGSGGALAAFVKLQHLSRSAREFQKALELSKDVAERWSGDALLSSRLNSDRGGLELLTTSYQSARTLLNKALADLDASDPPDMRTLPQVLVNLAAAELACDGAPRADALLARCEDLYRTHNLPDDPVRAEALYLRGASAAQRGDYAAAIKLFRSGLAACESSGQAAASVRFNLWLNTALIHKDQGDFASALQALERAAEALATFAEKDDLSVALIDAVRADLHVSRGQIDEAMALVPVIEKVCERYGKRGYLWVTARHVRALDRLVKKDVPAAITLWTELVEVQRPEGQLTLARTLNYLGVCAERQARAADAKKFYEESRGFEATHPRVPAVTKAITLWRLAVLLDRAGQKDAAKALLNEVFAVADQARLNTFGEAAQRATFFSQFAPAFEQLARWYARDGDGAGLLNVVARSRSRTLLDQVLAAGVDPRAGLTGPDRDPFLKREVDARNTISRLRAAAQLLPVDKPDDPAVKKAVADLEAAQKEYADAWREIVNADPVTRVLTDPKYAETSLAKFRKDASASQAAVVAYMVGQDESFAVLSTNPAAAPEIFRLTLPKAVADEVGDAAAGEKVGRVGLRGMVVRPAGPQPDRPPPFAGPAAPLTDLVAGRLVDQYLRQVSDPEFKSTRGMVLVSRDPVKKTLPTTGELLGDAVLPAALRARIKAVGARRVIVVPDAALHKIPFECLLVSAGGGAPRYALDELPAIAYAPSPAVLSVIAGRPRKLDGLPSLLTVGDPAYAEVAGSAAAGAVRGGPAAGSTRVGLLSGALPRLPYTLTESKLVQECFPPDRVTTLTGAEATEKNVAAAMPGRRFLHLAAHGFADDAFGNLFAAIALAPPAGGGTVTPENDGFLSLHEIYRLPLAGCELTVLSACTTNVGPQRPLEAGVTLAGAFLCAGSRGVMASCWSVDDEATADLMGVFFKGVKPTDPTPASYADSLKAARLHVRATKKPGKNWESPFYWAPFVFVGPPD